MVAQMQTWICTDGRLHPPSNTKLFGQKDVQTESLIAEDIQSRLRPKAKEIIKNHLENGDVLALITGSSFYLAKIWREMGIYTHRSQSISC